MSSKSSSSRSSGRPRGPTGPVKLYLTAYNAAAAAAWSYVLYRIAAHMGGADGLTGLKEWAGVQGTTETLLKRSRTAVDDAGEVVKWVQTSALLEVVHAASGLVRSPIGTTVAQVASRLALVWGVCEIFPEIPHSPFYVSMVTAWSLAEIIRYTHYATGLQGFKLKPLEWIRYTAFYILYPLGAGSEAILMFLSGRVAKEEYGLFAQLAINSLVSAWPVALFLLMSYMHGQRRKHLGSPRTLAPSAGKSSTATTTTPEKRARHDITSRVSETNVLEDTAAQTPARSTRSHTRKSQ
ncbi:hypothetical protein BMF94_3921 [Rhodotorula taiwanensis]|uniref:Very-long-chain (3R)-3-hydroxyacyl-CoA dehydratase n=1 Tax=Rhodotorula taiwanensis TaxID=741276 RepID=A0A2S5B8I1_9BASI|nr:hypothetical protein BMF94_3921 [Rhodotorula taiwanensis]